MGQLQCYSCGVLWTVSDLYEKNRRELHDTFYCPNGHKQFFPGQTAEEKRIAELERALTREREARTRHFRELIEDRDAERRLARTCPICGEAVAARLRVHENVTARLADHLTWEHGAKPRLRAIEAARETA